MLKKKIVAMFCIILCLNLVFIQTTPKAKAWIDVVNLVPNLSTAVSSLGTTISSFAGTAAGYLGAGGTLSQIAEKAITFMKNKAFGVIFMIAKVAALKGVQKLTETIIGKGGGGGIITDWNDYLINGSKQEAMVQMNSFFNTVSKGRASSLNYEGIGKNYDSYFIKESRIAITGQPFTTNISAFAPTPDDLFYTGNMKGIMTAMSWGNNVAGYTMIAKKKYEETLANKTSIREKEQVNGVKPQKSNGVIIKPAAIIANSMNQIDQQGQNMIMQAQPNGDDYFTAGQQIIEGAALSVLARITNYALADSKGKLALQNKNDSFPFSVSYSQDKNGGGQLNMSAGGNTLSTDPASQKLAPNFTVGSILTNTGNAAISSLIQGECAKIAGTKTVKISGQQYNCATLLLAP